jgi:hypothetical protein
MNRFLKILGGLFLVLLVVGGVCAAIFIPRGMALHNSATAYIQENLPPILRSWDPDQFIQRADPNTLTPKLRQELPRVFGMFTQLGPFKSMDKPLGGVNTSVADGKRPGGTWGRYVVHAKFEAGPADVTVLLHRVGEKWTFEGIDVRSPVFLPNKNSVPATSKN